jgi:hypothetical protein
MKLYWRNLWRWDLLTSFFFSTFLFLWWRFHTSLYINKIANQRHLTNIEDQRKETLPETSREWNLKSQLLVPTIHSCGVFDVFSFVCCWFLIPFLRCEDFWCYSPDFGFVFVWILFLDCWCSNLWFILDNTLHDISGWPYFCLTNF